MSKLTLGEVIKHRRKSLLIRQPDLAELSGISVNTLYKIERGTANPTLDVLNRIADTLGMVLNMNVKQLD